MPDRTERGRRGGYRGPRPDLAARNRGDGPRLYEDAEWMRSRFEDQQMTFREIAVEAGCGDRTIARWIHLHGIRVPPVFVRREARGNTLRGARNPRWTGGPPTCTCGKRMAHGAQTCVACWDRSGSANPKWRGDRVTNNTLHQRVAAARGAARSHACLHCGKAAAHWAYDHLDPNERRNHDGPYSLDLDRYMPLCVACHKRFDMDYLRAGGAACGITERN